ncbi:hypothetical protein Tsp_06417 [Trichinella spiralis]|uniref:hypothetical protein n=1 Tax=Trichinella spiralis TaxID=6334 RepID=UPI0001EFC2C9|nr:hypothetical protein Tsp_06417 [Trichinella spiralis]
MHMYNQRYQLLNCLLIAKSAGEIGALHFTLFYLYAIEKKITSFLKKFPIDTLYCNLHIMRSINYYSACSFIVFLAIITCDTAFIDIDRCNVNLIVSRRASLR